MLTIFLWGIINSLACAKGEVRDIYAHYEKANKTSYKVRWIKYNWGQGKNLIIDGFKYDGRKYVYKKVAQRVKIVRKDNKNAKGNPCGLFVQYKGYGRGRIINLQPDYPKDCDMAKVMGGRTINVGVLDLFINSGYTAKNVERVDFIFDDGIISPDKENIDKVGHVVTEKSGNNPIKIAAILSLKNGKPASYGKLITIDKKGRRASHSYGIAKIHIAHTANSPYSTIMKKQHLMFLTSKNSKTPTYAAKSYEPIGMSFVSLKDLGVPAKTKYYGFSLFGEDVDSKKNILTDVNTFPVGKQRDTADPYGGSAGYFEDKAYSDSNNDDDDEVTEEPVCKSDTNLLKNPSFENNYYKQYWIGDIWDGSSYIVPDGKRYVYVDKNHNGDGYQDVEIQPGRSYKLTFNAAMKSSYKNQKIIMTFLDKNKNKLNVKSEVEIRNNILPSRRLIPYTLSTKSAPENAKYLRVEFNVGRGDYLKVDNFDLRTDCSNRIPLISIDDAKVLEGDKGTTKIKFKVSSNTPIENIAGAKINYSLKDGTAKKGDDYIDLKGSFIIPKGEKTFELSLPIVKGDRKVEPDEYFGIHLYSDNVKFKKSDALGTIINDDYDIVLNATTKGSPFFNGKITTQIVNRPFNIILSAYNKTKKQVIEKAKITKIDFVDQNGKEYTNLFSGELYTKKCGTAMTKINIPKAYKALRLKITGVYKGKEYSNLSNDTFAVRPKKFVMSINKQNVAGENFSIYILAVDENNDPALNYNESIKNSFDIQFKEKNSKCKQSNIDMKKLSFKNGKCKYTTNYPEVGKLDFKISEIQNSEFAIIDKNDGEPLSQRIIPEYNIKDIEFVADHFDISKVSLEEGSKNFTYYAPFDSMQKMAEKIGFRIAAKNKKGEILENYNRECYAKDAIVSINFNAKTAPTEHSALNWQEDGNKNHSKKDAVSFNGNAHNASFLYDINKSNFVKGENNSSIRVNFKREYNIPKEPMRFTLTKVGVVDTDNRKGSVSGNYIGYFYYGRLHASDYMVAKTKLNARIFYEVYCNKCDRENIFVIANSPESVDYINWYRVSDYVDGISGFETSSIVSAGYKWDIDLSLRSNESSPSEANKLTITTNGSDIITFIAPRNKLPLQDRIIYKPKPWLLYKKFPSSDLRHSFHIKMELPPRKWAGKGNTGKTVDMHVSPIRTGIKIDW